MLYFMYAPKTVRLELSIDDIERFYLRRITSKEGCWEWRGTLLNGYGCLFVRGQSRYAHRISYELEFGPIPCGLIVCHKCDNRKCVRPDHLFLGTLRDNVTDRHAKGRDAKGNANGSRVRPDRRPRGEAVYNARLTCEKAQQIRDLYAAGGVTERALAKTYGVSRGAISSVLRNWTWAP